jgi:hypothetical protein
MAIVLGKDGAAPPIGTDIISVTKTEECEAVEITNRENAGGGVGTPGFRLFKSGFKSETFEIECHDPAGLITDLEAQFTAGVASVVSVTENASIDGVKTFTVTLRRG